MDVSVIVPVRARPSVAIAWAERCRDLVDWPGTTLQVVGVQCGLPLSDFQQGDGMTPESTLLSCCLSTESIQPTKVLQLALDSCQGDVIVWFGGTGYPRASVRWLAEATSRYDFAIAQSRSLGWHKAWSRLIRVPRRLWSGRTVKQPKVQLWAALRESLSSVPLEQINFQKLPQAIASHGFRVGQLLLPSFEAANELPSSTVHPWNRITATWRQATSPLPELEALEEVQPIPQESHTPRLRKAG